MKSCALALIALASVLLLPLPGAAQTPVVVDRERIIASPQGLWYVIVQPGGQFDLVQRGPHVAPMRSRAGEAPVTEAQIRLGATADELMRSAGKLPGLRPDPGDAIVGSGTLRPDPLDRLHVFDDGSGFVARYRSGPSRFDDLEPIREPGGSDVALVGVTEKATGSERRLARFIHLYTLKDALFWGDETRELVVMVTGGANLTLTEDRGAFLPDREEGQRPRLVAWSFASREVVPPPMDSLYQQMRSLQTHPGLGALLLARELEPVAVLAPLEVIVADPSLPHVTRLHAAATLRAGGRLSGNAVLLRTAYGRERPRPDEDPIPRAAELPEGFDALRAFAIAVLPVSHGAAALPKLLRLAVDPDPWVAERAERALREGPWPTTSSTLPLLTLLARDRSRSSALRAVATRLLLHRADPRTGELLTWLAADPDDAVSGAVLAALGEKASDASIIERVRKGITAPKLSPAALSAAVGALGDRAWRSAAARDALLALVPEESAPAPSAATVAALGALWRVEDARVAPRLVAWSASDAQEAAAAARHAMAITQRAQRLASQPSAQNP